MAAAFAKPFHDPGWHQLAQPEWSTEQREPSTGAVGRHHRGAAPALGSWLLVPRQAMPVGRGLLGKMNGSRPCTRGPAQPSTDSAASQHDEALN